MQEIFCHTGIKDAGGAGHAPGQLRLVLLETFSLDIDQGPGTQEAVRKSGNPWKSKDVVLKSVTKGRTQES